MGTGSAKLLLWMISDAQRQRLLIAFCAKTRQQQMEKESAMQVAIIPAVISNWLHATRKIQKEGNGCRID